MNWNGESARVACFKIWVFAAEANTAWEKWYSRISCNGDRLGQMVRVYAGHTSFDTKEEAIADAEKGFDKLMTELEKEGGFRRAQLPPNEES